MVKVALLPTAFAAIIFAGEGKAAEPASIFNVEPVPAYKTFDWSGGYAGLHVGYGWGHEASTTHSENGPVYPQDFIGDNFSINGFVGGAHLGYNAQFNQFVIGIEADIDGTDINGGYTHSFYDNFYILKMKMTSDIQGSLRVRFGYATDNWLFYATGGVAVAQAKMSLTLSMPEYSFKETNSDTNTHVGWTIGGGTEYAFTQNWVARLDVRYTDFGTKRYRLDIPSEDSGVKMDWDQTVVTAGVSYKF